MFNFNKATENFLFTRIATISTVTCNSWDKLGQFRELLAIRRNAYTKDRGSEEREAEQGAHVVCGRGLANFTCANLAGLTVLPTYFLSDNYIPCVDIRSKIHKLSMLLAVCLVKCNSPTDLYPKIVLQQKNVNILVVSQAKQTGFDTIE